MARQKLEGIYIPVVTPFNKDETINFSAIKEIAKFLWCLKCSARSEPLRRTRNIIYYI